MANYPNHCFIFVGSTQARHCCCHSPSRCRRPASRCSSLLFALTTPSLSPRRSSRSTAPSPTSARPSPPGSSSPGTPRPSSPRWLISSSAPPARSPSPARDATSSSKRSAPRGLPLTEPTSYCCHRYDSPRPPSRLASPLLCSGPRRHRPPNAHLAAELVQRAISNRNKRMALPRCGAPALSRPISASSPRSSVAPRQAAMSRRR